MNKRIFKLYVTCLLILVLTALYAKQDKLVDIREVRSHKDNYEITEYELSRVEDLTSCVGYDNEIRFRLDKMPRGNAVLGFMSVHQEVEVYINNFLLYSLEQSDKYSFGKTAGVNFNYVTLSERDEGDEVRIVLRPCYDNVSNLIPEIYVGDYKAVTGSIIDSDLPIIIMAFIAIFSGIILMLSYFANAGDKEADRNLINIGIFAIDIGCWKLFDTNTFSLIFNGGLFTCYMTYFTLLLAIIPLVSYVKNMFEPDSKLANVLCYYSIAIMIGSFVLHLFDIYDFRELLIVNHSAIVLTLIVCVIILIKYYRKNGISTKFKNAILWALFCIAGCCIDMIIYYRNMGSTGMIWGICLFDVFIIAMGTSSVRQMKSLITRGAEARYFEKMAYKDQLTGLYNRTYYNKRISEDEFELENCGVIMIDLNDLKYCNDNFGHEAGDKYIVDSGKLIKEVFGPYGDCCRMGGDEFCVIINDAQRFIYRGLREQLSQKIELYNKQDNEFVMQIACGYAKYDRRDDMDLFDTTKRADKLMYEDKIRLKANRNNQK